MLGMMTDCLRYEPVSSASVVSISLWIVQGSVLSGQTKLWTMTGCWEESSVRGTSVAVSSYVAPAYRSLHTRNILVLLYSITRCSARSVLVSHSRAP